MTVPQRVPRPFQHLDQHPTLPVPYKDVMRRLVRGAAHHVLCVAREADRVPWGTIDRVLEAEGRGQEAGERGAGEQAEGAVCG